MTSLPEVEALNRSEFPVLAGIAARGGLTISCDFDGTITLEDSVQSMLATFGDPDWLQIEAQWIEGRITSRECLRRQTALLRASEADLDAWTDGLAVDPDVAGFFGDCAALGLEARVLSDGYDRVIGRVLQRLGLEHVPVTANHLTPCGDGRWRVAFPHARDGCGAGACKCLATPRPRLHFGDGRSDLCVADASEVVLAKSHLLEDRVRRGRPVIPCANFSQARRHLAAAVEAIAPPFAEPRSAPVESLAS